MNLNIRKLLRENNEVQTATLEFDFTGCDFAGFSVVAPTEFIYTATSVGGSVRLEASIATKIAAECARCLAPVTEALSFDKEYRIREADLQEEFPELPFTPAGELDLKEFAYGELVLETPAKVVCSEDCEGLCARCGKPQSGCACEEEQQGDPRLAVLRQLLEE